MDVRVCHSTTTSLKAETSSIDASLLSHKVSSFISLISYLEPGAGVTLIAEVFVSKAVLLWGDGLGNALNGCNNSCRTSALERNFSIAELLSELAVLAFEIAQKAAFQELGLR